MQKRNRNMNTHTYICLYLHKNSRRVDEKLIETFMRYRNRQVWGALFFVYLFIPFAFMFEPCRWKEGEIGRGRMEGGDSRDPQQETGGREQTRKEQRQSSGALAAACTLTHLFSPVLPHSPPKILSANICLTAIK